MDFYVVHATLKEAGWKIANVHERDNGGFQVHIRQDTTTAHCGNGDTVATALVDAATRAKAGLKFPSEQSIGHLMLDLERYRRAGVTIDIHNSIQADPWRVRFSNPAHFVVGIGGSLLAAMTRAIEDWRAYEQLRAPAVAEPTAEDDELADLLS